MTGHSEHLVAVMDVLEAEEPRQLWRFIGDSEDCAEQILQILDNQVDIDPPHDDPIDSQIRVFTSDDAWAIAALFVIAPVIGAIAAAVAALRRRRTHL